MAHEPAQPCTNRGTIETMLKLATRMNGLGNDAVEPKDGIDEPLILLKLKKFKIIDGVVPDSMHQSNLGVGKQFTNSWIDDRGKPHSLPPNANDKIDDSVAELEVPNQLCRWSRSLINRKWWTAMECGNWIFFYSLPVLSVFPESKPYLDH
ncbi:hypothetical protein QAD02_008343 [Eretmocerus hayati]|uniref:Uncharacterized protein n=1 Tax=Eretmocerus hayati TaxID=131215 RepID=A0ACC2N6G7_9HYME|nr:hypothetical protein QAD02_008343 [Eretmocerus hayati]